MKQIIDIPEDIRVAICQMGLLRIPNEMQKKVDKAIQHGIPLDEQEPKIGHWIEDEFGNKCSYCGIHIDKYMKFNYCPNCGCRMFEPQERSE